MHAHARPAYTPTPTPAPAPAPTPTHTKVNKRVDLPLRDERLGRGVAERAHLGTWGRRLRIRAWGHSLRHTRAASRANAPRRARWEGVGGWWREGGRPGAGGGIPRAHRVSEDVGERVVVPVLARGEVHELKRPLLLPERRQRAAQRREGEPQKLRRRADAAELQADLARLVAHLVLGDAAAERLSPRRRGVDALELPPARGKAIGEGHGQLDGLGDALAQQAVLVAVGGVVALVVERPVQDVRLAGRRCPLQWRRGELAEQRDLPLHLS